MTKEIILQTVKLANRSGVHLLKLLETNHSDVLKEIIERTSFLDNGYSQTKYKVPFQARLYCIEHDITEAPRCQNPDCNSGKMPRWDYGKKNFKKFCGNECKNKWLSKVSSEDIYIFFAEKRQPSLVVAMNRQSHSFPCSSIYL